jgi:hypothetical protein
MYLENRATMLCIVLRACAKSRMLAEAEPRSSAIELRLNSSNILTPPVRAKRMLRELGHEQGDNILE